MIPASALYPIDLTTALRLAEAENPTIAEARTAILAALAQQQQARALLVPSFNAGTNYHGHLGNLQRSSGRILSLSEQSLYYGGGARTLAAETLGTPAVNVASPLTDALFEPLVARRRLAVAQFDAAATANSVLLEVAVLYVELSGAQAILKMQQISTTQTAEAVRLASQYAEAGEGRQADAERATTEWTLRCAEVQRAEEDVAVASARLARRLNLDPSVRLRPLPGMLTPLGLIDPGAATEDLIQAAIRRRPDVAARMAGIAQADARYREERARPFLPTLWMGFSGGAFGGGSNLRPPFIGHFAGRTDFDVRVFWTLQNLGVGNLALIKRRRAELGQAMAEQSRTINRARREVASARAEALAARNQIDAARSKLTAAEAGFWEDLDRARQNLGRPIEVLDNLKLLAEARLALIRSIVRYNQEQFRLFVALGSPPPLGPPPPVPPPLPPVTTPLHAPIPVGPP